MDGQEVKWSIGALKFGKFICSCYIADRGQHMRQIHIRKDETVYEGGAVPAKALRPVTVQSILVRIVGSAFVSQPKVCHWLMSKACECCHGALFSRGVATASLAEAMEEKHIIASLDFEKCFDRVHPSLAIATLKRKGLSPVCCSYIVTCGKTNGGGSNLEGQQLRVPTKFRHLFLKGMQTQRPRWRQCRM